MSTSILFMGPVGAGKTQAIHTISEHQALDTDQRATGPTQWLKATTTVAMDMGRLQLEGDAKALRLLGTPGQERFDFMWEILLKQAHGVILLINHSSADPLGDLERHLSAIEQRPSARPLALVLAVTHVDQAPDRPLHIYTDHLQGRGGEFNPPVLVMDARDPQQVQAVLRAVMQQLEQRLAYRAASALGGDRPALH